MKLGTFYFDREVGHYIEKEAIVSKGSIYEYKTKIREFVKTGSKKVAIEVEIDPQKVARMVSNAVRSKSGISRYLSGAVIGRRVNAGPPAKRLARNGAS
jgi:NDP-sugar pyrophosphorylase family protein